MVRFSSRFASDDRNVKGAERGLMMHFMLTICFHRATDLTGVLVARTHAVADASPIGAVVVRVVGPDAGFAQTRDRLFGEGNPIACGLQIGGRQVQWFFAQIFVCVPATFAEACHLRGHL